MPAPLQEFFDARSIVTFVAKAESFPVPAIVGFRVSSRGVAGTAAIHEMPPPQAASPPQNPFVFQAKSPVARRLLVEASGCRQTTSTRLFTVARTLSLIS